MKGDSIKPISYLKAHAAEVIRKLGRTGGTLIVTQTGEAKAVLQDITTYEATQESLALLKLLAQSRKSANRGLGRPLAESFARIRGRVRRKR